MAGIKQIRKKQGVKNIVISAKSDEWLMETIDEYLTGVMHPPRSGVFHPSTLSNPCDRSVWLIYHGKMIATPLEPHVQRIFQNGNFLEQRVEKWFQNLGILVGREIPVRFDVPAISGRIDFLIKHSTYGITPIELKSINTSGFTKLRSPKPEHEMQLQMYLNMARYDIGTVLYENKNDQKIKAFFVERDEKEWQAILSRCANIQSMTEAPKQCTGAYWCSCRKVKDIE